MNIHRRAAIKTFLLISAGVTLIPSCLQDKKKSSVVLKNIQVDADQEGLLAEIAETIIPATDTPGAKDIGAHLFALKMVDDCYAAADQRAFIKGLDAFDAFSEKKFDHSFVACTLPQRESLLGTIEARKGVPEEVLGFYDSMKKLTLQAYSGSKFYLTKVQVYELVPGRFHGCFPVKNLLQKPISV